MLLDEFGDSVDTAYLTSSENNIWLRSAEKGVSITS